MIKFFGKGSQSEIVEKFSFSGGVHFVEKFSFAGGLAAFVIGNYLDVGLKYGMNP